MRQEGLCAANTSVCFVGLMRFLAGFDYSGEVLRPNKQNHRELALIIPDAALSPKEHSLPGWEQNQGKGNCEWIPLAPSAEQFGLLRWVGSSQGPKSREIVCGKP